MRPGLPPGREASARRGDQEHAWGWGFYHAPAVLKRRSYPRVLIRGLVVFALGMTAFAAVASREWHSTATSRAVALSDYVALEASGMQGTDPANARALALAAYRVSPTLRAVSMLLDTTAGVMPTIVADGPAVAPPPATAKRGSLGVPKLEALQVATEQVWMLVAPPPPPPPETV